jgi:hypothetical protein
MNAVNNFCRWRWQIRGIWKEAKARKIFTQKRAFRSIFYLVEVKQFIKQYKEKIGMFRDMKSC